MGADATMDDEDVSLVDWRQYQGSGNSLNDKQAKMAERIRCEMRLKVERRTLQLSPNQTSKLRIIRAWEYRSNNCSN